MRNPRSFKLAPHEEEHAPRREEQMIVDLARHAMRREVEQFAPPGMALPLLVIAVSGMFSAIVSGLGYAPALTKVINRHIARSGWRLTPIAPD